MTSTSLRATLVASLLLGTASGVMAAGTLSRFPQEQKVRAAPSKDGAPRLTNEVLKHLVDAQTAFGKGDYPAALTAAQAAQAVEGRTPADDFQINSYIRSIDLKTKDLAGAEVAAIAAADADPAVIPETEKAATYIAAMQLTYNSKQFGKSAKYAKLVMALNPPADAATQALAAEALVKGGDAGAGAAVAQKNIDAAKAAGQKPALNDLVILMQSQIAQKNEEGAATTLETMVADYNRPADIANLLGSTLSAKGMRDIDYIYAGRLITLMGVKIAPADAQFLGQNANTKGFYGDAEALQKLGGPAPKADMEAADKKSLPGQIAGAGKQNGNFNIATAEAAYGYGQYADAERLARAAQTKGGAKDPTEPPMVIGMAQAAQGKYADAAATFDGIQQPNPAAARVARLWGYYVKGKTGTTAAAK